MQQYLTEQERREIDRLVSDLGPWVPIIDSPQLEAYNSDADVLFYGGSAGGAKTDLVIGLALTKHQRTIIYRRNGTEHTAILDRIAEVVGGRDNYNGKLQLWRLPDGRQVEHGSCPHAGDENKYQGRPHDLKVFDEITSFLESQFRFLCGWLRTAKKGVKKRIVCTGNPPRDSDGEWVIKYWGPWLDPTHPNPAEPGELRWYTTIGGVDFECDGPDPIIDQETGKEVYPLSRTFIKSRVTDNPYLMETGYMSVLQALPEPLRSQMLNGDFMAGIGSDPFQVIPALWVALSMDRWDESGRKNKMDSVGVDVARGGKDETAIAKRHGRWIDNLAVYPGADTPDGPTSASLVVAHVKDKSPIHVDVIGVGASVYDHLNTNLGLHVVAVNSSEATKSTDKSKTLTFANKRAEMWWKMRESLDPDNPDSIILPNDPELKADLCAPRWKLTARGIQVEPKDDIKTRIGRSTNRGDCVIYANITTPKKAAMKAGLAGGRIGNTGGSGWMGN